MFLSTSFYLRQKAEIPKDPGPVGYYDAATGRYMLQLLEAKNQHETGLALDVHVEEVGQGLSRLSERHIRLFLEQLIYIRYAGYLLPRYIQSFLEHPSAFYKSVEGRHHFRKLNYMLRGGKLQKCKPHIRSRVLIHLPPLSRRPGHPEVYRASSRSRSASYVRSSARSKSSFARL